MCNTTLLKARESIPNGNKYHLIVASKLASRSVGKSE